MRRTSRRPRFLAVSLGLSLLAAACSGGDGETAGRDDAPEDEQAADEDPAGDGPSCQGTSNAALEIGGVLPETGVHGFLGPGLTAAAQLAVQDVNEAGGVLGRDVAFHPGEEGEPTSDVARETVEEHLRSGVDVVLGPTSESAAFGIIDAVTEACVIQFSPTNTSDELTTYDDDGLYFRTAPSHAIQARALGDLAHDEGNDTLAVAAVDSPYGRQMSELVREAFESNGGRVVAALSYDATAVSFEDEVAEVVGADPDAVVLAGFEESGKFLDVLFQNGVSTESTHVYLTDTNTSDATGQAFEDNAALVGVKGILPGAETSVELRDRLLFLMDPELEYFGFTSETYDAVVVTALATEAAGTDDPAQVARHVSDVTRGGEPCTTFAVCATLVREGVDIDYDGLSGPLTFSDVGEPTVGTVAVVPYALDNALHDEGAEYRTAELG